MKPKLMNLGDASEWKTMAGKSSLHQQVNAYLAREFIWGGEIPADECLEAASAVINMVRKYDNRKPLKRGSGLKWRRK